MEIRIIDRKNKEANSLTTLELNDNKFALGEEDLKNLVRELYRMRQDIIEEVLYADNYNAEIEKSKEKISDLEYELQEANDRISELEDILYEEGIEY